MGRQPTHQPSRKSLGGAFGILELMPPIRRRTYRVKVRLMEIADYERIYALWMSTPGMGLNSTDDSRKGVAKRLVNHVMKALEEEGINKTALVVDVYKRQGRINRKRARILILRLSKGWIQW